MSRELLLPRFAYSASENDKEKDILLKAGKEQIPFDEAKPIIEGYPILFDYLKLIAEANGLDPWDPKVAEAYIIGNELLDKQLDYSGIEKKVKDQTGLDVDFGEKPAHYNTHLRVVGTMNNDMRGSFNPERLFVYPCKYAYDVGEDDHGMYAYGLARPQFQLRASNPFELGLSLHSTLYLFHKHILLDTITEEERERLDHYGF